RKRSYELQERRRWWQRGRRVVGKGIGVQKMDFVALPWKLLRWSTLHQQVPISSILSLNNGDSWTMPEAKDIIKTTGTGDNKMNLVTNDCNLRTVSNNEKQEPKDVLNKISNAQQAIRIFLAFILLDMILLLMLLILISNLTALRYSNSATSGGILDKAIEAEHRKHGDFMRLDHIEGYLELSAKTKYANEDVSLGSWFIGVDVEHIDDRRLCCGTPPAMCVQTASGKPKQATSVLLHLIGAAAAFAILRKGLRRFIGDAGKAKRLSGMLSSKRSIASTQCVVSEHVSIRL
ncbi:hypothetical protein B296_00035492, partial [Ensete ventricosum]